MINLQKSNEAELVDLTLSGVQSAYVELMHRTKNKVYAIAYGIISEHYAAEDITQDTFVDAYMQLTSLKEKEKFCAWVCGIVRRKAYHHITRRKDCTSIDAFAEVLFSENASPEDEIIRKESISKLYAALSSLSEKNREVARLFYFCNQSIEAIAKRLHLPRGTIKSRLYEARTKLKGELAYMKEQISGLSPDFEKIVTEKIKQLKNYHRDVGLDDIYKKLYSETEQYICSQPDSTEKHSALADLYYEMYIHANYDKELETNAKLAAEKGKNGVVLSDMYIYDVINSSNYNDWIRIIDTEALPKMDEISSGEGRGQLLLWRGAANLNLRRLNEAVADFNEVIRLLPKDNIYLSLAHTALKTIKKLEENSLDPFVGYGGVIAESIKKVGQKLIFTSQPGFGGGGSVLWNKHTFDDINWFASRFDDIFYDLTLKEGIRYKSKDGSSTLEVISYNETVGVMAGVFDKCIHVRYLEPTEYNADIWYAKDVGIVKAVFYGVTKEEELYELFDYTIKGGEGYYPFCEGNRWNYIQTGLPDYVYQSFENEIVWTDGESANLSIISIVAFKKDFENNYTLDSDYYISQCEKLCSEHKVDEAIKELRKAIKANTTQKSAMAAIGGIEYLGRMNEFLKKGYRLCPSYYDASYLTKIDGRISYGEAGAYSFGPFRWGGRFEENRRFGTNLFRFLQMLLGYVWSDKWTFGYSETLCKNIQGTDNVTRKITIDSEKHTVTTKAGKFDNCMKVTFEAELPNVSGNYYFDEYQYLWCGKKEFWFKKGVGVVRFDYTWGEYLKSSCELVSYVNLSGDESYMPLALGCEWEYDEVNLTNEGYRAKRIIKVACGMGDKFLVHDMLEFFYLGTEEEYEAFKERLKANKS